MNEYWIPASAAALLAIFCVIRLLWVMRAVGFACAYCARLHFGKLPSMASMLLRVWHWDALRITRHDAYIKHRADGTGPYSRQQATPPASPP